MAKTKSNARSQIGYLAYKDIADRIANQVLDMYDVVFTNDTHECIVISPDLIPFPIKSKVYTFNSIQDAETFLNNATDTYQGQFITILNNDKYKGYIVNQTDDKYVVSPISESVDLDYNSLGNRPIENLVGTLDSPITVSELQDGIYSIKGQYKISSELETVFLSANNNLFIVSKNNENVLIKKISSNEILDYSISSDGSISTSQVVTSEYLKENEYVTETILNEKLKALDFITREESENYIKQMVESSINATIDEAIETKIDEKINEKIQPTSNDDIENLF